MHFPIYKPHERYRLLLNSPTQKGNTDSESLQLNTYKVIADLPSLGNKMPSPSVGAVADLAPLQPSKPSSSYVDNNDDDAEIEYEEVEEEIEVEEEEDEIGEDLTPIREENNQNDTSRVMEPNEHEEHVTSGSVTPGIPISNPQGIHAIEESSGNFILTESSETRPKEEPCLNGERTSKDSDQKALCDSEGINELKTKSSAGVDTDLSMIDNSRKKVNVDNIVEKNFQTAVEAAENTKLMSSRLDAPHMRPRDFSSTAEFSGENKRPRIICEFHAKGWCIKGNSCRFLHIKERDLEAVKKKSEFSAGEASSVAHLPTRESEEKWKSNSEKYIHYASPLVKGSSSNYRNTAFHGDFSSCSSIISDNYRSTGISSYGTSIEGMIDKKSQFISRDHSSRGLSHSLSRPPFSFSSSSWNTEALPTRKLLESSREHYTFVSSSLQRSSSSFSGSESESLSRNIVIRDADHAAGYKTKTSSDDWEPSVPFRPSHSITQKLLFQENLYDPIRHSIEQTNVGDGLLKSYSDQGATIKNTHLQSNNSQEDEKLLNSARVKDLKKVSTTSSGSRLEGDRSMNKIEPKVEEVSQNNEHDIDMKTDGHVQTESKTLKYFQTALVEFVKDLVKPTWREGLLSRDAHKLIVKKAVDKVLSTLQPDQIPSTDESVNLYLSVSQPKLAKLVEGYIDKYGKS
ncbi:Zinc finger family protein [Abeliophyllum distichum]|uniref:Zinc finger family protein n=1 Tax=Abeliophyllum distichum TaxID=126358 RepID=A0ABD1QGV4_9LAMI